MSLDAAFEAQCKLQPKVKDNLDYDANHTNYPDRNDRGLRL